MQLDYCSTVYFIPPYSFHYSSSKNPHVLLWYKQQLDIFCTTWFERNNMILLCISVCIQNCIQWTYFVGGKTFSSVVGTTLDLSNKSDCYYARHSRDWVVRLLIWSWLDKLIENQVVWRRLILYSMKLFSWLAAFCAEWSALLPWWQQVQFWNEECLNVAVFLTLPVLVYEYGLGNQYWNEFYQSCLNRDKYYSYSQC